MAISITITVPDGVDTAMVKDSMEWYAVVHGDLEQGQTFTGPQAQAYVKGVMIARVKEIVLAYRKSVLESSAGAQALQESNDLTVT